MLRPQWILGYVASPGQEQSMPQSADPGDGLGLMADKAILDLGTAATRIEALACKMDTGLNRIQMLRIIDRLRDEEARRRRRIRALAKAPG